MLLQNYNVLPRWRPEARLKARPLDSQGKRRCVHKRARARARTHTHTIIQHRGHTRSSDARNCSRTTTGGRQSCDEKTDDWRHKMHACMRACEQAGGRRRTAEVVYAWVGKHRLDVELAGGSTVSDVSIG